MYGACTITLGIGTTIILPELVRRGQPSRIQKCPKSYLNIPGICYTAQKTPIFILEIVGATTIITNIIIKRLVKTCFG